MIASSILSAITVILITIYLWCKRTYTYWERHGIPFAKPTVFIGNTKEAFSLKTSFGLHLSQICNQPEMKDEAVVGVYIFNQPGLIVKEPELIKSILIKDFNLFINRYGKCDPHGDALGNSNLFFARDNNWKELRTKISPVFTSGKIKQMYPLMLEICSQLEKNVNLRGDKFTTEVKDICGLFTTDLISSIAFGINANSLKNPEGEFRTHCRKMMHFNILRAIEFSVAFFMPKLVTALHVKLFDKEFSRFLRSTINKVMNDRESSGIVRHDLIEILVALRKEAPLGANEDALVAQAAVFLTAGFETSASTMAFALLQLAKRPEIQERLRKEIVKAVASEKDGNLSYETITSMEYLGMVVDEVLRLYPVLPFLDRQHEKPKGVTNGFSLKPYYNYTLPDEMPVYIPIFALHRNPEYWPNPNTFDPERFSPENKKSHTSMTYLPFGTGSRNCIGSRIGLLQTKLGLVHFLKNHYVMTCNETIDEGFDAKALVLQFAKGITLTVTRDNLSDNLKR